MMSVGIQEETGIWTNLYEKHKMKMIIGSLIVISVALIILLRERKDLLIAALVILYLVSPAFIYLLWRWEEAEQEKKTAYH